MKNKMNSHPKVMGFDDHYMKSISILFKDGKLCDCGTVKEQKEIQSEKHQHTPPLQRRAKLFTNHVNTKTTKTGRNLWSLLMSRHQPCDAEVTLSYNFDLAETRAATQFICFFRSSLYWSQPCRCWLS